MTSNRKPSRPDPATPFTDWAVAWFEARDWEPVTETMQREILQRYLLPAFGERPLGSIRAAEILPWEESILRSGRSQHTARAASHLLILILHAAGVDRGKPTAGGGR
ncbi:phage integrase central domain-containing protein [Nonomuraea sediminis]|uniref:phage integrase central domain-containing protein n=1 Tax=Nonomuraea sediminis TaxID=2835864 RepID=UPI001BDC121F|nr:hypothetical protein [Nonomuraea sediminis]